MGSKTHPSDAAGLAKVIAHLRKEHAHPHKVIADHVGVSRQAVHKWPAVPIRFVGDIEKLTGIPKRDILPHTFAAFK